MWTNVYVRADSFASSLECRIDVERGMKTAFLTLS